METLRKPFEGIGNILRFNWHFYAMALVITACLLTTGRIWPAWRALTYWLSILSVLPLLTSLIASHYIYDRSPLYTFDWLEGRLQDTQCIVNIHAGFDETSTLLQKRFRSARIIVFDFYDPTKHTERSIQRARQARLPFRGTQPCTTENIPLKTGSADVVFLILSAHEIRNERERHVFFRELKRILKPGGHIVVTEHLRDLPNFLVYTIGFFHFMPAGAWRRAFRDTGLRIEQQFSITPFIRTFILCA